jgi:ribosomal protein S17E
MKICTLLKIYVCDVIQNFHKNKRLYRAPTTLQSKTLHPLSQYKYSSKNIRLRCDPKLSKKQAIFSSNYSTTCLALLLRFFTHWNSYCYIVIEFLAKNRNIISMYLDMKICTLLKIYVCDVIQNFHKNKRLYRAPTTLQSKT